jgi:hypothetical protein
LPDCQNELNSIDWMPNWIMENRDPSFVGSAGTTLPDGSNRTPTEQRDNLYVSIGSLNKLYLLLTVSFGKLGNVPAINILNLEQNEGIAYTRNLSLCFAGEFTS